jgi:hypothetical protein
MTHHVWEERITVRLYLVGERGGEDNGEVMSGGREITA